MTQHIRKSHFLGTKLHALRKRNGLTLEELSARCIQLDSQSAPSVSYLSMIESGKRVPSQDVLGLLSSLFQRDPRWFLDGNPEMETPAFKQRAGGAAGVPLEPAFLFSKELLQAAIPELLAQTGTTGRQFAHLLIRSHQEMSRNDFPDLERSAERVGERKFPLGADELTRLCKHHGLTLRWFDRKPVLARDKDRELRSMVRSFFESPRTVYLNRGLQADPARLKFDLASHLGQNRAYSGGCDAAHDQGIAVSLLAFLRRLSARVSARGVSRQRDPAALGQHGASHRSLSAVGGFSHAQREPRRRTRLADFSVARR